LSSLPVPVNNNLNRATVPPPIAGSGVDGALGGVKVDGSTIVINPETGVISAGGGGQFIELDSGIVGYYLYFSLYGNFFVGALMQGRSGGGNLIPNTAGGTQIPYPSGVNVPTVTQVLTV
jgi:hypothetical protein